jgi:putative methionine-R-sulfoxide reductase with GAF domain
MKAETASGISREQRDVLESVRGAGAMPLDDLLDRVVEALHSRFSTYTGVYLYWMDGPDALVLRAFRGRPTEHTRIPVSVGICGRAAREKHTVIVDVVAADPSYLACSLETRSEIVVPIMKDDVVYGEIDIDGDAPAAYGQSDQRFLEEVARLIALRLG